jgi:hypothetical protein
LISTVPYFSIASLVATAEAAPQENRHSTRPDGRTEKMPEDDGREQDADANDCRVGVIGEAEMEGAAFMA